MSVANSEQPIFTCHAHVFHIDPKTKRTWITASTKAVAVSFFYDSSRNLYRIISVEGSKAVINSTITPNMSFTQTSQKFGQWSDVRANTVYGLGFSSEAELTKFVEKFQEVKEATKNAVQKNATNGTAPITPVASTNTSPVTGRTVGFQQQPPQPQHPQPQQAQQPTEAANNGTNLDTQSTLAAQHKVISWAFFFTFFWLVGHGTIQFSYVFMVVYRMIFLIVQCTQKSQRTSHQTLNC